MSVAARSEHRRRKLTVSAPSLKKGTRKRKRHTHTHTQRERDVGIICVIIYDDLALEAWTQRREMWREWRGVCVCVCVCVYT